MVRRLAPILCLVVGWLAILGVWKFAFHGLPLRVILFPPPSPAPPPPELDRRVNLSVRGQTLAQLAPALEARVGVPIRIGEGLAGLQTALPPLDLEVRGISLRTALDLLANETDPFAGWVWRGGAIEFVILETWHANLSNLETRVQSVGPLLVQMKPQSLEDLPEVISEVIAPTSWDWMGGTGTYLEHPGGLLVSHTPDVHRRIERLVAALDRATDPVAGDEPIPVDISVKTETEILQLKRLLMQPAAFQCSEMPVSEALEQVARRYDLPLVIHQESIRDGSFDPATPVTIDVDKVPLRRLIASLLQQARGDYVFVGGILLVTSDVDVANGRNHTTWVYPVADLLAADPQLAVALSAELEQMIYPECWVDMGGVSSRHVCEALVVRAPARVHERVEQWLRDLRRGMGLPGELNWIERQEQKIETDLRTVVDVDYRDTSLREILREWSVRYGWNLLIDEYAVAEDALDIDGPQVSYTATGQRLEVVLRELLEPHLEIQLRDGGLRITTQDREPLEWRFYDLPRWALDPHYYDGLGTDVPYSLYGIVDPPSWSDNGGEGAIMAFETGMCVYNSRTNLERIERVLAALRRMEQLRLQEGMPVTRTLDVPTDPRSAKLATALESPIRLEFHEASLAAATEWISRQVGLQFEFAPEVRTEALQTTHVSCSLETQPLEDALQELLQPLGYRIGTRGDTVLVVPDPPAAPASRRVASMRIYDVADLRQAGGSASTLRALAEFADMLSPVDDLELTTAGDNLLVSLSRDGHAALEELFGAIRAESDRPSRWIGESGDAGLAEGDSLSRFDVVLTGETIADYFERLEQQEGVVIRAPDLSDDLAGVFGCPPPGERLKDPVYHAQFGVPLRQGLESLLSSRDLKVFETSEGFELRTALRQDRLRVYPVQDVLAAITRWYDETGFVPPYFPATYPYPFFEFEEVPGHPGQQLLRATQMAAYPELPSREVRFGVRILGQQLVVLGSTEQHQMVAASLQRIRSLLGLSDMSSVAADAGRRLNYTCREKPVLEILADLSRLSGVPITLSHEVSHRRGWLFQSQATIAAKDKTVMEVLESLIAGRELMLLRQPGQLEIIARFETISRQEWRAVNLEPIRRKVPHTLDELVEFLVRSIHPAHWVEEQYHSFTRFGDVLVFQQSFSGTADLERLLEGIRTGAFPANLNVLDPAQAGRADELVQFIDQTDDALMRGYGLELFGRGWLSDPAFARQLLDWLVEATAQADAVRQAHLLKALGRFDALPPALIGRLVAIAPRLVYPPLNSELVDIVAKEPGQAGVAGLVRLASTPAILLEARLEAIQELHLRGPQAENALPDLLKLLLDSECRQEAMAAVNAIDEDRSKSKALFYKWSASQKLSAEELKTIQNWLGVPDEPEN